MFVCVHAFVHVHVGMYVCMYCMYVVYACYVCMYVCTCMCVHTCTRMYMHVLCAFIVYIQVQLYLHFTSILNFPRRGIRNEE